MMAEKLDEIAGVYDCSFRPYYSGGNYLFGQKRWGGDEFHTDAHIVKYPEGYNLFLHNNKIKMSSGIGSMEDFLLRPFIILTFMKDHYKSSPKHLHYNLFSLFLWLG